MTSAVKSAGRVFEVLEYFEEVRGHASVSDISRALNYPQSSTSALLKTIAALGYLDYEPRARRYCPSHRVALLGSWIAAPHLRDGLLMKVMEELGDLTGETIILAERAQVIARYIHIVPATKTMRLHLRPGTTRPLGTSGIGRLLMSALPEDEARVLVKRINAEAPAGAPRLVLAEVLKDLAAIREAGYSISLNTVTPGAGVVSMLLPRKDPDAAPLALGIGGFADSIAQERDRLVGLLREAVRKLAEP